MGRANREFSVVVPINKGHYPMVDDSMDINLQEPNIPLGFYHGHNTAIVNGIIRSRPELVVMEDSCEHNTVIGACVWTGFYIYALNGGSLRWCKISDGSTGYVYDKATGAIATATYNKNVSEDGSITFAPFNDVFLAVGGSDTPVYKITISGGAPVWEYVIDSDFKGVCGVTEARLFVATDDNVLKYSERGDISEGYDKVGGNEFFVLGWGGEKIIHMENIAGEFYVLMMGNSNKPGIRVFKKIYTLGDTQYITMSSFTEVFNSNNYLPGGQRSFCPFNGRIYMWLSDLGLITLGSKGIQQLGPYTDNPYVVADSLRNKIVYLYPDEAQGVVVCTDINDTETNYVYNVRNNTWGNWSDLGITDGTTSHYAARVHFAKTSCWLGKQGVVTLGKYTITDIGSGIAPYLITPALNLGYPTKEKILRRIRIDGVEVQTIKIYTRIDPNDDFVLAETISNVNNKGYIIPITNNRPFVECVLRIEGNGELVLKKLIIDAWIQRELRGFS